MPYMKEDQSSLCLLPWRRHRPKEKATKPSKLLSLSYQVIWNKQNRNSAMEKQNTNNVHTPEFLIPLLPVLYFFNLTQKLGINKLCYSESQYRWGHEGKEHKRLLPPPNAIPKTSFFPHFPTRKRTRSQRSTPSKECLSLGFDLNLTTIGIPTFSCSPYLLGITWNSRKPVSIWNRQPFPKQSFFHQVSHPGTFFLSEFELPEPSDRSCLPPPLPTIPSNLLATPQGMSSYSTTTEPKSTNLLLHQTRKPCVSSNFLSTLITTGSQGPKCQWTLNSP